MAASHTGKHPLTARPTVARQDAGGAVRPYTTSAEGVTMLTILLIIIVILLLTGGGFGYSRRGRRL
jgi:hypothetical protein